ncbi:MAG: glycosyltransferase [Desulfuromonadaceae bacterium]|nr:glycosyltransferase [Desulfuromonadaceae bacterium]
MEKKRILVGHPYWGRGGAEIAAMWMLQALISDFHVAIVTRGGWDITELNHVAGTNIPASAIDIQHAPFANSKIFGAVLLGYFSRFCRKIAPAYDLCITASRVIDWGVPAIHFLSDVTWNHALQKKFESAEYLARKGFVRNIYWRFADLISGESGREPGKNDVFVANSQWTAKISEEFCTHKIKVLFPPVPGRFLLPLPWEYRDSAFVCLGRISPEKNIEQLIEILERVREKHSEIILHLIGKFNDDEYSRKILELCNINKDWIIVHNGLYGNAKEEVLHRCRYGISACSREAFGIATAEMIKAGVIPFVPLEGAQRELLEDERLCYKSVADAENKIYTVMDSTVYQTQLHSKMHYLAKCFTTDEFCSKVRLLVQDTLS